MIILIKTLFFLITQKLKQSMGKFFFFVTKFSANCVREKTKENRFFFQNSCNIFSDHMLCKANKTYKNDPVANNEIKV